MQIKPLVKNAIFQTCFKPLFEVSLNHFLYINIDIFKLV